MLPVDEILPELKAALRARSEAVLVAPPGAGKTTHVPPALLDEGWARIGKIILLSPRRIAARAAAARMASERGERVGATIGYRVRLDSRVGPSTRIEVVTEGVFTRMILDDPELRGVAAVLFDEFHERSLEGDLGLALARDAQTGLRPDLKLLVMSATLDASRIAALLGNAPVIVSEGRMFPVALRYRPRDPRAPLQDEVAAAVSAALAQEKGSALVFLPGAREIERTAERLREQVCDPGVDVRPLFGAMSPADQDAAIAPSPVGRRKVVLATSIAETSLTIEGVRIVVDAGLSRRSRFEPGLGLSHLETVRASQAAITQRAGRAGRLEPGVCWRLWHEGETRALPEFDRPDILDADLSGLALDLAAWGVSDPAALTWLDPPPKAAWTEAVVLLKRIGALDEAGRLTAHGRMIAKLPLPPRLAHMVARAAPADRYLAALLAVVLTEQRLGGRDVDASHRVDALLRDRGERARAARALAARLAKSAGGGEGEIDASRAGVVLAVGFPERVAKARGVTQTPGIRMVSFLLANGRAAGVPEDVSLARSPFVVIADATGVAQNARILSAASIAEADVERIFARQIETHAAVKVDAGGTLRGRRVRKLGRIVLSEAPLEKLDAAEMADALREAVRDDGLSVLDWSEGAMQARARVALMRSLEGEDWPDWNDEALLADLDWLPLEGVTRLKSVDVGSALLSALPYELRRRLDAEAPTRFETPAGSLLQIDYTAEGGPALDVRLQEMFGQDVHPKVARGRVPLTLRLLSPAHRPVQTTKDLPGFWRGSYAAVRSEMRGRYPKHPWPD
ncbi:MAG: ATP-dependent helicase HrpB, partial [Proteobacteria bacterium]|nr:ATP-dependent helicase HrpB [Pseudomonadota bacterium]